MENEQNTTPEQGCTNCGWKNGDKCCGGKWGHKRWKHHGGGCHAGGLWFMGWLFTVGFLKLSFWKGVLAIVIWAYYLGAYFAR